MSIRLALAATLAVAVGAAEPWGATAADQPPRAAAPLVSFTSGDGFTFWNSVVIRRDGRAALRCSAHSGPRFRLVESRSSFRLAPRRLAALRRALAQARFATLADVYPGHGADAPSYAITYGGKRVYVGEFAIEDGKVPRRLVRVISMLNDIVEPEAAKALAHPRG